MVRRIAVAVLLACALLAGATGCVQVPQPISATEPDRPALSKPQAVKVMANLHSVMARADRTQDGALAATVLNGPELRAATGAYARNRQTGEHEGYQDDAIRVLTVASRSGTAYPQEALVVGQFNDIKRKDERALRRLVRASAGAGWRLDIATAAPASGVPMVLANQDGVSPSPATSTPVAGLRIDTVGATLVAALNHPGTGPARLFAKEPWALFDASLRQRGTKQLSAMTFSPASGTSAFRTAAGGLVIQTTATYVYSRQAASGYYFTFTRNPVKKAFPKRYASIDTGGIARFTIVVPKSGRAAVLSRDESQTSLTTTISTEPT